MWIILSLYLFNILLKKSHRDVFKIKRLLSLLPDISEDISGVSLGGLIVAASRKFLRQKQLMKQKNEIRFSEAVLAKKTKSFTL